MTSSTAMIAQSTSPPSSISSRMASKRLASATMALLGQASNDARGLFFENLDQGTCTTVQQAVDDGQRNRDHQAQHRRDQRHGDAVGHHSRVAGAEQGDLLEGQDHTD